MIDVQNQRDHRNIEIDKVGIKHIRYPITVLDKVKGKQRTVASIDMYVNLPRQYKGTHMSRFIEVLSEYCDEISLRSLRTILEEMNRRLNAKSAHLKLTFPYFIEKKAPVTNTASLLEYQCSFNGSLDDRGLDIIVELGVPIATLCPCSKEISEVGAHNQRGEVRVAIRFKKFLWIEDLIRMIESSASAEVFSLLKRNDEKFLTEIAYKNPMFVEDVVREVAQKLNQDKNIIWFTVGAETYESIHNHNAYAFIERWK
ncbi:MAG: GTP cyclohydrolase I FolE2 [Deltaproteobacteria bacterium]|nr:GTP cyclohydrolase I FolE2 [Deltaproteobacteria bacterium]MBW2050636.1 GTP cyclohydrolase I FolE2 [Deltaproteobacteria bacterium]MBW2139470.1 GTP cyclohydrolase I FolE2 [Deltaproteobacteria bacterium]MBW2322219.1 GTP cyclohydrolase I FolE2 [Deltaproteobacteria bacterium]